MVNDPHLKEREMFVPVQFGAQQVTVFGSPIKLSGTPTQAQGAAPGLGQHNREVYIDWLQISESRFEDLRAAGVI